MIFDIVFFDEKLFNMKFFLFVIIVSGCSFIEIVKCWEVFMVLENVKKEKIIKDLKKKVKKY